MVNIIKEKISLEESLKKKIEFICEFAKVQPTIINDTKFLAFNYSNEIFIENLSNKIRPVRKL